jgi:hypothetical protein
MATSGESTFIRGVYLAEQTRQLAKTAAFNTWGWGTGATLTTYVNALDAADNAYVTAVNALVSAAVGVAVPNQATAGTQHVTLGTVGIDNPQPVTGGLAQTFGSVI